MSKITLILLCMFSSTLLKAQLQNPSFEQTDTLGTLSGWSLTQGKATQKTSAQFGVIPFTPFLGNFFLLLESDTQSSITKPAILTQAFAFADTPGNISFHYFYIPESIQQHAQLTLLLTTWNGLSRDTVLFAEDMITAVADSNSVRIQWNTHSKTLKGLYRTQTLPDTAIITFQNDDGLIAGKDMRLYLDDIRFGQWATGIREHLPPGLSVYPNPADRLLFVNSPDPVLNYSLMDMKGNVFKPEFSPAQEGFSLNLQSIPEGLYLLQLHYAQSVYTKRILINHAE